MLISNLIFDVSVHYMFFNLMSVSHNFTLSVEQRLLYTVISCVYFSACG